jgi:hypothetical protein
VPNQCLELALIGLDLQLTPTIDTGAPSRDHYPADIRRVTRLRARAISQSCGDIDPDAVDPSGGARHSARLIAGSLESTLAPRCWPYNGALFRRAYGLKGAPPLAVPLEVGYDPARSPATAFRDISVIGGLT